MLYCPTSLSIGSHTFSEIDITPAIGCSLIVTAVALIVRTGL